MKKFLCIEVLFIIAVLFSGCGFHIAKPEKFGIKTSDEAEYNLAIADKSFELGEFFSMDKFLKDDDSEEGESGQTQDEKPKYEIFKYDPNSDYYTDECFSYTTENGTDILLNDRQDEYNDNNMAVCENNCKLNSYDSETKQVICDCPIKQKQIIISEMVNQTDLFYYNFTNEEESSNMNTIKCYYTLFTKEGFISNIVNNKI